MILEKIIIENFRQFHGRQEIAFSTFKKKNVTVIHAENGFGKTALLNAFLWGFYGAEGLTDKLEKPESIINESLAYSGQDPHDVEARVTILFRDGDEKYTLSRSLTLAQQRNNPRNARLELEVQRDGETFVCDDRPQWLIETLMPVGISRFLFFDGEGIEHLAMERNAGEITKGIHQMLGLTLLQRAIEDLRNGNVRGRLVKELKENTDEQTVGLIEEEQRLTDEITQLKQRLAACKSEQTAVASALKDVDAKLDANREAHALQQRRQQLEQEKVALADRFKELTSRLTATIAEDGFMLFAEELVTKGREISLRLRSEGRMPAPVMNSYIEELLTAAECICGCRLDLGTPARARVESKRTPTGDHSFNNAVASLEGALKLVEGTAGNVRLAIQNGTRDREDVRKRLREIELALDEIHQKLGGKDDEEVHKLEEQRESWRLKQRELDRDEVRLEDEIAELEVKLEGVRRQIESSQQQQAAAQRAQRRLMAVDSSIDALEKILQHEMEDLRQELNDEIDTHFRKIISKEYWAELSEEFVLRIKKRVGIGEFEEEIDVGKSGGEAQITSLVFIASLVALAQRRDEIPTILKGLEGGEYPMVMDSPFGQLGDDYRAGVAKWIPTLAPQVVILVTSSQYKGAVERELEDGGRIGRRYLLAYHGPSKRQDAAASITIGGKRLTQYYRKNIECTEVRELES